jgi:hypothetical protein
VLHFCATLNRFGRADAAGGFTFSKFLQGHGFMQIDRKPTTAGEAVSTLEPEVTAGRYPLLVIPCWHVVAIIMEVPSLPETGIPGLS